MVALGREPVVGPAGALLGGHFDARSPASIEAHVQAIAAGGFGCFGLSTEFAPWLSPPQQQTLKRRVQSLGLRGWQTTPGHALDDPGFSRPSPRWHAALAYHEGQVAFALASGLEGSILTPPPQGLGAPEEVEEHIAALARRFPGAVWVANSDNPSKRVGTAQELADFCRATGARPCYNAPAHALRAGRQPTVDDHRESLRELGPDAVILHGNLVVQDRHRAWNLFEAERDRFLASPVAPLYQALRETGRIGTPVLVRGPACEHDAHRLLNLARRTVGLPALEWKGKA